MEISKTLAEQIVTAIYEVVNKDTNLINPSGIIIGSTNTQRIGTFHAAGAYAVRHDIPVFVDPGHPFQGAKDGINYPIHLDQKVIAAIGITGSPEELKPYGFLITKITEVFFKEQQLNQEMLSRDRALHYLVTSLIHGTATDSPQFDALFSEYQIDPSKEYAAFSIKFQNPALENSLKFYFQAARCRLSLYLYPNEWVVLFSKEAFKNFSPDEFSLKYQGQIHAGLGDFGALHQLNQSYRNAVTARKHARRKNQEFCNIRDISMEFVLESIPQDIQKLYAGQLLCNLTEKEKTILSTYLNCSLSLKDAAAALFIHKNTLQYQLDRITQKTGLNPRNFQDAFLLQFAFLCYK